MEPYIVLQILKSLEVRLHLCRLIRTEIVAHSRKHHHFFHYYTDGKSNLMTFQPYFERKEFIPLTLLHSERPKLCGVLAFLSAKELRVDLI